MYEKEWKWMKMNENERKWMNENEWMKMNEWMNEWKLMNECLKIIERIMLAVYLQHDEIA